MSGPLKIEFQAPTGNAIANAIAKHLTQDKLGAAVGRKVIGLLRDHLYQRDKTPNALGGKRTHFYAEAARSTHYEVQPDGVLFGIEKVGIRQRLQGGTIRPVNRKYLTIPAIAAAHGRRALEFDNLQFVRFGKGASAPAALIEKPAGASVKGKKVAGGKKFTKATGYKRRVFYWLVKSVNQKADPGVLPTEGAIRIAALDAIDMSVKRALEKEGII